MRVHLKVREQVWMRSVHLGTFTNSAMHISLYCFYLLLYSVHLLVCMYLLTACLFVCQNTARSYTYGPSKSKAAMQ